MPCSKYSRQILSQGRLYMSGTSYWMTVPGWIGVGEPSTGKIVCTHSMKT